MNKATMLLAAAVLIAMTGCGKSSRNAQTTATGAPGATAAPAATPATGAAAGATPPDCNGQSPVWAIYRAKVFLLPGDPHYGTTKRGYYICLSQAQAEGYRHARGPLGHHHHHRDAFSM